MKKAALPIAVLGIFSILLLFSPPQLSKGFFQPAPNRAAQAGDLLTPGFPYPPSNPTPASGTSNVPVNQNFSWTGGDPTGDPVLYTLKIRMANDSLFQQFCQIGYTTNTSLTCDPANILVPNTHYFWYVQASDGGYITNSDVWEFYTAASGGNAAPYLPTNPVPAMGATNIPLAQNFAWNGGDQNGDSVTYFLYIKPAGGAYVSGCTFSSTSLNVGCDPSFVLQYNTLYLWYVWATDGQYDTVSSTWSFTTEGAGSIPAGEYNALVDLYNGTGGPVYWVTRTGWLVDPNACNWYGITCINGHVTGISMEWNNLKGNIPATIDNLTYLSTLDISRNALSGSIPPDVWNLIYLDYLDLSFNNFSAWALPAGVGNFAYLQTLYLNYANLTGTIPTQIGNLGNLKRLSLASNSLSGSIPSSIGNLVNLVELSLASNDLTGIIPSSFGNLSKLVTFSFAANDISGPLPGTMGNLINVEFIYLSIMPNLSGGIPASFGSMKKLKELYIFNDPNMAGRIPMEMTTLTSLEYFYFHQTSLCEPDDPVFTAWKTGIANYQSTGVTCKAIVYKAFIPRVFLP